MKKKPIAIHPELFEIMHKKGIRNENMAAMIGLSGASFSLRKHREVILDVDRAYEILEILNIPKHKFTKYFSDRYGNFEEETENHISEIIELEEATLRKIKILKDKLGG